LLFSWWCVCVLFRRRPPVTTGSRSGCTAQQARRRQRGRGSTRTAQNRKETKEGGRRKEGGEGGKGSGRTRPCPGPGRPPQRRCQSPGYDRTHLRVLRALRCVCSFCPSPSLSPLSSRPFPAPPPSPRLPVAISLRPARFVRTCLPSSLACCRSSTRDHTKHNTHTKHTKHNTTRDTAHNERRGSLKSRRCC